jgi:hypothetical protein
VQSPIAVVLVVAVGGALLGCGDEGLSAARAEHLASLGPVTYSEQDVRAIIAMGRDASADLPADRADELQALFETADVDAICEEMADNASEWDGSYDASTVNTKFVLMAGMVSHDQLDEVNEQCVVSLRWMLTAGASD